MSGLWLLLLIPVFGVGVLVGNLQAARAYVRFTRDHGLRLVKHERGSSGND